MYMNYVTQSWGTVVIIIVLYAYMWGDNRIKGCLLKCKVWKVDG